VRGTVVYDYLVVVAGRFQSCTKRIDFLKRDAGIITTHETQQRAGELVYSLDERCCSLGENSIGMTVEPDGSGKAKPIGGLMP